MPRATMLGKVLVICSTNRAIQAATQSAIDALVDEGAAFLKQSGATDVALARNIALTSACNTYRLQLKAGRRFETLVMVDDDMVFTVAQITHLVDASQESGVPTSAFYTTEHGRVAANRLTDPLPGKLPLWMVGLGCIAVPFVRLLDLEEKSRRFELPEGIQVAFTACAMHEDHWLSEDYRLCLRLGGAHLLPIGVGHIKSMTLWPEAASMNEIAKGNGE